MRLPCSIAAVALLALLASACAPLPDLPAPAGSPPPAAPPPSLLPMDDILAQATGAQPADPGAGLVARAAALRARAARMR